MSKVFLVKTGKSYTWAAMMKTVAAFDTYEECEDWIYNHIQPGQHMYIEPVEKISKQELHDILKVYDIVPIKG